MHNLASDSNKFVVVLINDYYSEWGDALKKLSTRLGRPLKGIVLVDKKVKEAGKNSPDTSGLYEEVLCDYSHIKSLSDALKPYADNLLLVASSSERNQPYLKKALSHMPYINAPTESSLDWATHKATMRELLRSYNPDLVPKFMQITDNSPETIKKLVDHLTFPVIIKPNGLATSILVKRANDRAELEAGLQHSFDVIEDMYNRDRGRGAPSMVIEEFIEGDIYSVDSYVNEEGTVWSPALITVINAFSVGKEGFYSYQTETDSTLTDDEVKAGHNAAKEAVHALGLRSTVAHIELFHTKTGWKIIELGARAGGYRQDMYWLAYGMDHAYNEFLIKSGLPPEIPENSIAYSTAINIYAEQEGIIDSIDGFDAALKNPSISKLTLHKQPGDMALFCGNGGTYVIDGILYNTDAEQLRKDVQSVRDAISIHIRLADKI